MGRFRLGYYLDRWVVLDARTDAVMHCGFYRKAMLTLDLLTTGGIAAEFFIWHSRADGKML